MDSNLQLNVLVERYHNPTDPPCHQVFTRAHSIEGILDFFGNESYAIDIALGKDHYWNRLNFVRAHSKAKTKEQKNSYEHALAQKTAEMEKVGEDKIWLDFPNYAETLPQAFGLENLKKREAQEHPLRNATIAALAANALFNSHTLPDFLAGTAVVLPLFYYGFKKTNSFNQRLQSLKENCKLATDTVKEAHQIYTTHYQPGRLIAVF
jgi:hypothetical protein